jgi:septum formation protein
MKKNIILWSTSPRRKEILSILGIPFEIVASEYEEDMTLQDTLSPEELALLLSRWKWENIKDTLIKNQKQAVVIAADTFVIHNNKCLGKPFTKEKQIALLEQFSWNHCEVITWVYVFDSYDNKVYTNAITSSIYFKTLSSELIERYVNTEEWLDRAGWFAVQEKGNILIDHIHGDRYNIVWLPLSAIFNILQECKAV